MAFSDLAVSLLLAMGPLSGIILALYSTYLKWHESPFRKLTYPPGPPSKGLLSGNVSDIPKCQAWVIFAEWAKKYGDIVHFRVYRRHVIVLNSVDDAVEMFEKRSGLYSDRPKSIMTDLMGWDFHVGLMPYGDEWRLHRRLYQQCFRPKASLACRPIQTQKIHNMLHGLLTTPDDFGAHCRTAATAIIMGTLYGHDLSAENSKYFVDLAEQAVGKLSEVLVPGAAIVDYIPILLRRLPAWFPGGEFKRAASEVKLLTDQMQDVPMDFVGKGLLKGTAGPSLVAELLENCYMQRDYNRIKNVAATSYAAGADTTVSSMTTFFLAMALYPEAQKKSQDEIDKILGADRLPSYDDRASLPYTEALYRELLRWRPTIPLNVAHVNTEDDIYKGYYIPKGTTIIANTWAMTRDETKYPNAELFMPERFLDKEGRLNDNNLSMTFGFGRRICPGRHMASATIWLSVVSVLATFNIRKKKDSEGKYTGDVISHPLPFECSITPRRVNTGRLIREAAKI